MTAPRVFRLRLLAVIAVVISVAAGGYAMANRTGAAPDVPTADVTRGDFIDYLQVRGDIRPAKSIVLSAPTQAGELQILKLAKNGSAVKAGDVLVEFDATSLRHLRFRPPLPPRVGRALRCDRGPRVLGHGRGGRIGCRRLGGR